MHKNIHEISDQIRINIEVTPLNFSANQLKTQNKNILENSVQKLINRKIFSLQNIKLLYESECALEFYDSQ